MKKKIGHLIFIVQSVVQKLDLWMEFLLSIWWWRFQDGVYGSCCSYLTLSTGQVPVIVLFLNKVIMHFFCSCRGCLGPLYQILIIIQVMLYWYGKFCNQDFQIAFFQEYWLLVQQKIGNLQVHFFKPNAKLRKQSK